MSEHAHAQACVMSASPLPACLPALPCLASALLSLTCMLRDPLQTEQNSAAVAAPAAQEPDRIEPAHTELGRLRPQCAQYRPHGSSYCTVLEDFQHGPLHVKWSELVALLPTSV
jgi:hypothetical protein